MNRMDESEGGMDEMDSMDTMDLDLAHLQSGYPNTRE
jgi:hypothetical protein